MDVSDDPPCDLAVFIAERHGLRLSESLVLLAQWMNHYEPRGSMPNSGGGDQPLVISAAFGRAQRPIVAALPTAGLGTTFARR
jgi:hypothetical protein